MQCRAGDDGDCGADSLASIAVSAEWGLDNTAVWQTQHQGGGCRQFYCSTIEADVEKLFDVSKRLTYSASAPLLRNAKLSAT